MEHCLLQMSPQNLKLNSEKYFLLTGDRKKNWEKEIFVKIFYANKPKPDNMTTATKRDLPG